FLASAPCGARPSPVRSPPRGCGPASDSQRPQQRRRLSRTFAVAPADGHLIAVDLEHAALVVVLSALGSAADEIAGGEWGADVGVGGGHCLLAFWGLAAPDTHQYTDSGD